MSFIRRSTFGVLLFLWSILGVSFSSQAELFPANCKEGCVITVMGYSSAYGGLKASMSFDQFSVDDCLEEAKSLLGVKEDFKVMLRRFGHEPTDGLINSKVIQVNYKHSHRCEGVIK